MNVAIILAAGESRRMGAPKQLLPFAGKTMLQCVIDAFRIPEVNETIVVLGYKADEIAPTLRGVRTALNRDYTRGMFSSVQAGLQAVHSNAKLVLVALSDQPKIQPATVRELVKMFQRERHKILVPSVNGRQGHPLLLAARYIPEILAMDESLTLKHFLANHPGALARHIVSDEGVLVDIDDRAGYERELRRNA